jgi:signal peptidase
MILKRISQVITYALVLVFILTLYSTVSSRINGGTPRVFGKEIMSVLSGSMEPGIKTGSIIAVKPVASNQQGSLKPGDVITYKKLDDPNAFITHRIVSVEGTGATLGYITKGDNNDSVDPKPIPMGNVVAKYANFTIPYLGYFLTWVKSKIGIAIVMIIPGVILIISSIISIFRYIVRMDTAKEQKGLPGETPPATNG